LFAVVGVLKEDVIKIKALIIQMEFNTKILKKKNNYSNLF